MKRTGKLLGKACKDSTESYDGPPFRCVCSWGHCWGCCWTRRPERVGGQPKQPTCHHRPPPHHHQCPLETVSCWIPAEVINSTLYIDDVITSQGCAPSARLCFPTDLSSSLSTGTRWLRSSATWTFTTTRSRKLKASGKQSCLRSWTRCSTARKHCWMLPANGSLRKRQVSK